MPKKYRYDLGHYAFQNGRIGSLMTLSTIPLIAGDVMSIDLAGIFRLSPLRRNLTVDARVDIFGFYVPYRQIYGQSWIDFMKEGIDEAQTFSGDALGTESYSALGGFHIGTRAAWLLRGYNRIWNRYFRHPTDDSGIRADTATFAAGNARKYGIACAHMPSIWNTPIDAEVDSSDLEVSTAGDVLDLTELAQQKARLKTERRREFFSQRYNDVMRREYGTSVNIDADERPLLIMRSSQWMSGYDVDGTGDATLGQYAGKSATLVRFRMPRRMFSEHGTLWIMALVRFPPIHNREMHYLAKKANPTFQEISGQPDVMANEPPGVVDLDDYFGDSTGHVADAGIAPFGQWYRHHPNSVHRDYHTLQGFTFLSGLLTTKDLARYVDSNAYDTVFQTTQLGHWQCQSRIEVDAERCVPPVEASIFAGT